MRKIKDLTAEDFPGIDHDKFESWKQAQLAMSHAFLMSHWFIWPALILELMIRGLVGATIFLISFAGWMYFMLTRVRGMGKHARTLGKKAGIEGDVLRRALRGEKPKPGDVTAAR